MKALIKKEARAGLWLEDVAEPGMVDSRACFKVRGHGQVRRGVPEEDGRGTLGHIVDCRCRLEHLSGPWRVEFVRGDAKELLERRMGVRVAGDDGADEVRIVGRLCTPRCDAG